VPLSSGEGCACCYEGDWAIQGVSKFFLSLFFFFLVLSMPICTLRFTTALGPGPPYLKMTGHSSDVTLSRHFPPPTSDPHSFPLRHDSRLPTIDPLTCPPCLYRTPVSYNCHSIPWTRDPTLVPSGNLAKSYRPAVLNERTRTLLACPLF